MNLLKAITFTLVLLAIPVLLGAAFVAAAPAIGKDAQKKVHPATHALVMNSTFSDAGCSATAVFRHAIMTASHCERPNDTFQLEDGAHKIFGAPLRDGNDHSVFLTDATFDSVAEFGSCEQGDAVFIFGNPEGRIDLLRTGIMAGTKFDGSLLFDLNGFHGDSGAAIFNERGQICAVFSYLDYEKNEEQYWTLIGAFPLRFTAEQLKKAREFDGLEK